MKALLVIIANETEVLSLVKIKELQPQRIVLSPMLDGPINQEQGRIDLCHLLVAIHWSLCRPDDELHQKINNIGHSDIVEEDPFYKIWSQVDMSNYTQLSNFKTSGLGGAQWPKLEPIPSANVKDYVNQYLGSAY